MPDLIGIRDDEARGLRWFSGWQVTVDGVTSERRPASHGSGVARQMFQIIDDVTERWCATYRYRPHGTVDEDRYVRTGQIHAVGCVDEGCLGGCRG